MNEHSYKQEVRKVYLEMRKTFPTISAIQALQQARESVRFVLEYWANYHRLDEWHSQRGGL